jgi:hypothetical protein
LNAGETPKAIYFLLKTKSLRQLAAAIFIGFSKAAACSAPYTHFIANKQ